MDKIICCILHQIVLSNTFWYYVEDTIKNNCGRNLPSQVILCHSTTRMERDDPVLCGSFHTLIPMITISVHICNHISQKIYDDIILSLQLHQLVCPCGHSSCLTVHGYYYRSVKVQGLDLSLRICRVLCGMCGHTHALLPSALVPYSQVPLSDQAGIIAGNAPSVIDENPLLDESTVRSILRRFRKHWEQKLLSQSLGLYPLDELARGCLSAFGRQFMQIKRTPNILFF